MAESRDERELGLLSRMVRALELIASVHVSRARDEAGRDVSRLVKGVVLGVAALAMALPVLLLLEVAATLTVRQRFGLGEVASVLVVAGGNALLALALAFTAKRRLSAPLLVETRATLKRAIVVVRGA